jgi:hypothetical protein
MPLTALLLSLAAGCSLVQNLRLHLDVSGEADAAACRRRRVHELADGRKHGRNGLIVRGEFFLDARLELIEAFGAFLV